MTGENQMKEVRKYVFDYFLANCRAPILEEIMGHFEMTRNGAAEILEGLEAAHHVIRVPGTNRILMASPFSALATPFRVAVGDKNYYGVCAWDAVAYHVMLTQDTRVDSFCHHCAEPILAEFSDGKLKSSEPSDPLVYLSLPAAKWWDNIVLTCANHMVFFSSSRHLDEWRKENHDPGGEALSLDQTLKISIPIYKTKMSPDYERPSKEELMGYWDAMDLRGDFWKL